MREEIIELIEAKKRDYIVKYNLTPNVIIITKGLLEIVGYEKDTVIMGMRVIIDDTPICNEDDIPVNLAAGFISTYQDLIKVMAVSKGLGILRMTGISHNKPMLIMDKFQAIKLWNMVSSPVTDVDSDGEECHKETPLSAVAVSHGLPERLYDSEVPDSELETWESEVNAVADFLQNWADALRKPE